MIFADVLSSKLMEWGASIVGFSRVDDYLTEDLSELKSAITIGVRLSDHIIDQISDAPTYTYFHHYKTVNTLIDQITLKGMLLIQEKGYKAVAVPASQTVNDAEEAYSSIFPHKTAAVCAGLGWVGKNALFISNEFGPRIRLGTILTDMEVPIGTEILLPECGDCRLCVDSCPAMALTGETWSLGSKRSDLVDAKACSDYMNANFKHIGRGSVCGICVKVCPRKYNSKYTK